MKNPIFGIRKTRNDMKLFTRPLLSVYLLGLCIIYIFILGLIPEAHTKDIYYSIVITIIFIFSYISATEGNKRFAWIPILAIAVLWISELMNLPFLMKAASITTFIFFFYIIVKLMKKVVVSKVVTILEFTESINAYLLFGIAGSLIFYTIYKDFPGAFNMPDTVHQGMSNFVYFTFVTLSTLGYGDITPLSPFARSMSIFFSVSGQLYLAMIVAVLVGKFISRKTN